MKKWCTLTLLLVYLLLIQSVQAFKLSKPYIKSNIDKGFIALKEYDYFKARKIFYTCQIKYQSLADFGLAVIYYRNDNPFHQIDSAYNCIKRCESLALKATGKLQKKVLKYKVSNDSIAHTKKLIEQRAFEYIRKENTIAAYELYMQKYWQAEKVPEAAKYRNSLAYMETSKLNTAAAYQDFMSKYPTAQEVTIAKKNYELALFKETTANHTVFV
jgi:hypothetical protein